MAKVASANAAALFAGGVAVGSGLLMLARSMAQTQGAQPVLPRSATAAKRSKPEALPVEMPEDEHVDVVLDAVDSKGVGPAAEREPLDLEKLGAMGLPRSDDKPVPAAKHGDTRMNLSAPHTDVIVESECAEIEDASALRSGAQVIDMLAYKHSDAVFVYESAASGNFGAYSEMQARDQPRDAIPHVFSMQARAGAGGAIAGYLAGISEDARQEPSRGAVTVLTNASGLQAMAPALAAIPAKQASSLVLQVSSASHAADSLRITNDYATVMSAASLLGDNGFTVVFSSSRQDAANVAQYAYARRERGPILHVFDGAYAARERGRIELGTADANADPPPFAYTGPSSPETVLLLPNGSLALKARASLLSLPPALRKKIGVVSARVVRPWNGADLREAVPQSVKSVRVLEETSFAAGGVLYTDVLGSALQGELGAQAPVVQLAALTPGEELTASAWAQLLYRAADKTTDPLSVRDAAQHADGERAAPVDLLTLSRSQLVTFIGSEKGLSATAAEQLAGAVAKALPSTHVRLLARYDNFGASGVVRADIVLSEGHESDVPVDMLAGESQSHLLVLSEAGAVLRGFDVFASLRPHCAVFVNVNGWSGDDLDAELSAADKRTLATRAASVSFADVPQLADDLSVPELKALVLVAASAKTVRNEMNATLYACLSKITEQEPFNSKTAAAETQVVPLAYDVDAWAKADSDEPQTERPLHLQYNSFGPSAFDASGDASQVAVRATWALAAWQMLFREAYALDDQALRPDLPEKTWNVEVTVNKRLTPADYDRNVFHLELSTAGTDLHYAVGEALGVHGWNDDAEVHEFIDWSGLNPEEVVSAPSVTCPGRFETRTVFQVLQQNLDLFGKPPKSFFGELGKLVASKDEARWLRFISSAEGSSTFKKLSESETVTYADVLRMFPSTRANIDWLMQNVELIKPRHYSIASAEAAVGDSVHLLVVTVDWKTPRGSPRFGQCTRYLASLTKGTKVTVSLKPSVMKLPPIDSQPIIMAGLGTGAAPFRAFIQARAVKRAQGVDVGPLLYYFGSRYQSAEYLYGEELEAYLQDGLLTHMGLAFSRDTAKKVYVQHKIKEDGRMLAEHLVPELKNGPPSPGSAGKKRSADDVEDGEKGIFTLCGPVWPVPDIHEALVESFIEYGWTKEQAEAKLDELKEHERYVLEVY